MLGVAYKLSPLPWCCADGDADRLGRMDAQLELFFESESKFLTDNPEISGHFTCDGQGQVAEVIIKFADQEIHAKKKKL